MRTNIVLDKALVERAQELTGIKTKRAVVDEALRVLIRLHEQADGSVSALSQQELVSSASVRRELGLS